ncbi:MAG TPA: hypothetical protein P5538_10995 [Bacteroidales bacterium]|jgi:hypothetical protein|nr:hypothetical protein [Bacteroidales bacterium]HOL99137.1 hypothetical protein [Bacteroidales bacterium]HOM37513.1 hypothetical protein [Bacteroidales bacterium]HPD25054.1 hypothetical protein [Bacteroidales bacterium]HRT00715.1 hypothetical protein [Bacteroidales bacterium]
MYDYDKIFNLLILNGYEFKTEQYLRDGFNIFRKNIGGFVLFFSIYFVLNVFFRLIPSNYSILLGNFLYPIFFAGTILVANEILKGNTTKFIDFFNGIKYYLTLLILNFFSGIIVVLGLIFLIIPGIYLWVSFYFAPYFVVFLGYDFWPAMILSQKIFSKYWWQVFGFLIIVNLINFSGLLLFGFGIIFTIPLSLCITFVAFEDIVGSAIRKYSGNFENNINEN